MAICMDNTSFDALLDTVASNRRGLDRRRTLKLKQLSFQNKPEHLSTKSYELSTTLRKIKNQQIGIKEYQGSPA